MTQTPSVNEDALKLDQWQTTLLQDVAAINEASDPKALSDALTKYESELQQALSFVDSLKQKYASEPDKNSRFESI